MGLLLWILLLIIGLNVLVLILMGLVSVVGRVKATVRRRRRESRE